MIRQAQRFFPSILIPVLLSAFCQIAEGRGMAKEYEIKAAFWHTLSSYITWPEERLALIKPGSSGSTFNFCILGHDPFQEAIDIIAKDSDINGYPVKISRLQAVEQAGDCHTLFISDSERLRLPSIITWLQEKPVLVVSDIPHFASSGGAVQFYIHSGKIRMAILPEALQQAGLKASAHLFRVAKIVTTP